MESISLQNLKIVEDQLHQIKEAIQKLELWNASITDVSELVSSPDGMKTLAADCMLIEAIGEGIKRIDERTHQLLLLHRSEIPWKAVKGMRDHIAHGYFDINTDFVWDVIKNDLPLLKDAINFFIGHLYEIVPFED
ncbi:MAG: DUF86 domain-containing protein [Prevotella sp.]|nr:DUF86 domain-containing protein [Prevotella sp.]MCR5711803.1 DUF86 domain-containing protein [Prevotella sp.]